jgi:hypothetical protein
MEPRFGHDFADVRVHSDRQAAQSARAVNAQAYTVGRHIVLADDQLATNTYAGRKLLAHELTHVLQQRQTSSNELPQTFGGDDHHPAEVEADRTADRITGGVPGGPAVAQPGPSSHDARGVWIHGVGSQVPIHANPPGVQLQRLGANPNCSDGQAKAIHQAIFDARSWLNKAIPALAKRPLDAKTLASLRRNFGPTYGVAANAGLIHDRLVGSRNELGTIPFGCATAPGDAICAQGHCGYSDAAGSHTATICTNVTLAPPTDAVIRAACVLHESFHAAFTDMDVDSYSGWHHHVHSTTGYPGAGAAVNADSYTTLVIDLS